MGGLLIQAPSNIRVSRTCTTTSGTMVLYIGTNDVLPPGYVDAIDTTTGHRTALSLNDLLLLTTPPPEEVRLVFQDVKEDILKPHGSRIVHRFRTARDSLFTDAGVGAMGREVSS